MARPSADPSAPAVRDPSEPLLQAFVVARRRGDAAEMSATWKALLTREWTRIAALLRLKRHDGLPNGRLTPDEIEDVTQQVWLRLFDWLELEGSSMGEFRAIIRKQVHWAFQEHVRSYVRDDVHRAGSLDEAGPDDEGASAFVRRIEDELADRLQDPLDVVGLGRDVTQAVQDLPERRRRVVVLRLRGYTAREVAARLDLEPANVDQLYSRGLADLRSALKDLR